VKAFEGKMLDAVFDNFLKDYFKKEGMDEASIAKIRNSIALELQPIAQIHLHSAGIEDSFSNGDLRMIWLFGSIAICIFLLACINFINLSTARSMERAKEVGVRKAVGSQRSQLVQQFLAESVILSMGAFVLGLFLACICLPFFNEMANKSLAMPWTAWWFLPIFVIAAIAVGLLAGLYPALYMCAFQPIRVLKGNLNRSKKNTSLRSALVVFQFATSAALVIGSLVVLRQMNFISNARLGYEKDQVLLLQGTQTLGEKIPAFKQEIGQISGVKNVSSSDFLPIVGGGSKRNGNTFRDAKKSSTSDEIGMQMWDVDHSYISTLGMKIVDGRDFSKDMASDSQAVIINQTMAKSLHFDQPIGQRIANNYQSFTVIGVVEDFHFESLKENIGNLCLRLGNSSPGITVLKINTANMPQTIEAVTKVWKEISPSQAIRYTFLDESFARMYDDVQRQGRIFTSFAVFAILIACLGLFALATYMAEQRTKEIGIRKVLGASVVGITTLLAKDFLKLVGIAVLLAAPVAYYFMDQWLADFAYRIQLDWWIFATAGIGALIIAFLTVGFQSMKAALANPVKSLKSE
jgi:putative ABC transport system permease protein